MFNKINKSKNLNALFSKLASVYNFFARTWFRARYNFSPIKNNKVFFLFLSGTDFCCNPKYIALKLLENKKKNYDIVCCFSDDHISAQLPEGIRRISIDSPEVFSELASSKIWVMNKQSPLLYLHGLQKRQGQYYFQTWHGSLGIKTIANDAAIVNKNSFRFQCVRKLCEMTDFWVSNSTFESEVYRSAFPNVKEILLYGHPRNDILINGAPEICARVKNLFSTAEKKVLLYAPSHRGSERVDCFDIDREMLLDALKDRFGGEWVIMFRLHPHLKKYGAGLIPGSEAMIDATDYPDIQELMLAADALLTDFSSCVFDFMLTGRPGFLYTPDIEEFEQDRGFYYPLETTPFPIGKTNEELAEKIRAFDAEKYAKDVEAFLEEKGCVEDGHASERVVRKINELMGLENENGSDR